jgi:hypothetical protein
MTLLLSSTFDMNSPIVYLMYGLTAAFVVAQSLFYLIRSIRRAKVIGMSIATVRKVIYNSFIFSILPAFGIAVGVLTLVGVLGIPFPALRETVIGSIQYETQMAAGAAEALTGSENGLTVLITNGIAASDFVTIALVMTVSIMSGPLFVLFFYKRLQPKIGMLNNKSGSVDGKKNLGEIVFQIVFIGMVLGYLAMSIASAAGAPLKVASYYNLIAVVVAAIFMYIFDILINKVGWKWLDNFSTTFSMFIAMAVVGVISYFANKNGWAQDGFELDAVVSLIL